jgi:hypothetical protein
MPRPPIGFVSEMEGMPKRSPVRFDPVREVIAPMQKTIKVFNRAEKGALKGKPTFLVFNGQTYPDGIDRDDESTWLQPGEEVLVEKDVILTLFGYIMHKALTAEERSEIIRRFGDWKYEGVRETGNHGQPPTMKIIGPPLHLADLVLTQIDSRNRPVGQPVAVFDVLQIPDKYQKPAPGTIND